MQENVENQPIIFVSYETLDSSYSTNGDIPEDFDVSKSQLSNKAKERPSAKIKKKTNVYPCNHGYQNCRDNNDKEDEMVYEESDLEDDDDDGYFDDDDDCDCDNDIIDDKFESLNMDSTKGDDLIQLDEDKSKNQRSLCGSTNGNAKIRCQYLCSVLNPLENTTQ
ncbi:hypothetical protein V6N12_025729 [Hibiscus sabdariffa]|uniref:Uncharacterized protein n=1 Tax=Hibiscus sabdariffa TaxID=183260 RepID=A0ABR2ATI4_9ROSI